MGTKNLKGTVCVENIGKRIRLRWRFQKKRYSLNLFHFNRSNLLQAKKISAEIEGDLKAGSFDCSLNRYKPPSRQEAPISQTNLIELFEFWRELVTEITDYDFPISKVTDGRQDSFYFYGIERIKFRSLDTSSFLRSVILKHQPIIETKIIEDDKNEQSLAGHVVLKTMKVPFGKIDFLFGSVSFPIFIEELNQEIIFEIANPDIMFI